MIKVSVLYGHPSDPEAFEHHYANTHVPLVDKMPNVARFEASRVIGTGDGSQPPYYRMAELWFDSREAMQQSMGTPEGQATVDDLGNFATGGATVMVGEID